MNNVKNNRDKIHVKNTEIIFPQRWKRTTKKKINSSKNSNYYSKKLLYKILKSYTYS